jgi:hypothetical protein
MFSPVLAEDAIRSAIKDYKSKRKTAQGKAPLSPSFLNQQNASSEATAASTA